MSEGLELKFLKKISELGLGFGLGQINWDPLWLTRVSGLHVKILRITAVFKFIFTDKNNKKGKSLHTTFVCKLNSVFIKKVRVIIREN